MRTADVVVIGAGITGLSTAYWAARAGAKVIVLDKGAMAYEASSRATGYLSLRAGSPDERPLAAVAERLWDTLDEELGYPTEWSQTGRLWAACNEAEWDELKAMYASYVEADLGFELIDAAKVREFVPGITDATVGGLYTPRSGHANPQRTSQAFAWAFMDLGGEICEFEPALRVVTAGGKVTGVETPTGVISTGTVVSCAGPQNGLIAAQLGLDFHVASARFEAVVTAPLPPLHQTALIGHGLSVRQTKRGNLHVNGGDYEWVDVELTRQPPKPSSPLVRNIARRILELLPAVGNVQLLRCWSGVVDITPDEMCTFERFDSPKGLIMASTAGHGFGLAPASGLVLSQLALNGGTNIPIAGLSLKRFSRYPADWRERRSWHAGQVGT